MQIILAVAPAGGSGAVDAATTQDWVLLWLYLALALGVSFLCSMLEASLLSLTPSYTQLLVDRGSRAGRLLQTMKADIDQPLAAILTLNTVAHTVGAAGVGAQAAAIFGRAWVGLISALLTLLILILSEIIPKTIGAVWHKQLATFTAYTTRGMILLLWPLVAMCMLMSRWIAGSKRPDKLSRDELASLAHLGRQHGTLAADEYRIMRNLIALHEVPIGDVMTPRNVVYMLPADQTVGELMREAGPPRFARIPVYRDTPDELIGYVTRYELLGRLHAGEAQRTMQDLARPLLAVPERGNVGRLLRQMVEAREHLAQVVDEYGGTAGIVTLEDLIETLLGVEIVDETDPVADMRELARRRRSKRIGPNPPETPSVGGE
ncbi:MAG: CNNM domain-containing protein [Phycisphaeraceae bacterium]